MCKELIQTIKARNWALASFGLFKNPHIHINVTGWPNDYVFILNEVPQRCHLVEISSWFSRVDTINEIQYVIYDKDVYDYDNDCYIEPQNLYIHRFEDEDKIFYGLYDEEGKRVSEQCLLLSDKSDAMDYSDAEGKCPDRIEQIEV